VRWLALARGGGSSKKRSRGLLERLGLKRGPKLPRPQPSPMLRAAPF
jgi:hypothetical protein